MNEKQKEQLIIAKNYAQLKKGSCLAEEYKNNSTKLKWACEHNHFWESTFKTVVQKKSWCPECAKVEQSNRQKKKNGLEEAKLYAQSRGGECLSSKYVNANTKLLWKCSIKNHKSWEAIPSQVVRLKTWCPECAANIVSHKKTKQNGLQVAKEFAQSKNGKCLSNEYISNNQKLLWICENKHTWESSFSNVVNNGTWCPQCSTYYRKEHIIRDLLEYLLNSKFPKKKPKWNINPKTNKLLELDGYSKELKIAFEFQGLHHYESGIFYKTENDLEYIKYKDQIKKQNCLDNNVKLLIIDDKFKISEKDKILSYVLDLMKELKIKVNTNFEQIIIDEIFNKTSNIQKDFLEKAIKHAQSKNGQCLSTEYIDSNTKLKWKCDNLEHKPWEALYSEVVISGTWCPRCIGRFSQEEQLYRAIEYAKNRNGQCLSTEYINSDTKLKWKCNNLEHKPWEATFSHVVVNNTWCPRCKGKFSKEEQLSRAIEYAKTKNGQCLSHQFSSVKDKMKWKCDNLEHEPWESDFEHIVNRKRWCPKCAIENLGEINKNKNGLEIAKKHAEKKGGICLSEKYINNSTKMKWKCDNPDHDIWEANYSNVVGSNKWCPECAKEKRKKK